MRWGDLGTNVGFLCGPSVPDLDDLDLRKTRRSRIGSGLGRWQRKSGMVISLKAQIKSTKEPSSKIWHLPCILLPTPTNLQDWQRSIFVCNKTAWQCQNRNPQWSLSGTPHQHHVDVSFIHFWNKCQWVFWDSLTSSKSFYLLPLLVLAGEKPEQTRVGWSKYVVRKTREHILWNTLHHMDPKKMHVSELWETLPD